MRTGHTYLHTDRSNCTRRLSSRPFTHINIATTMCQVNIVSTYVYVRGETSQICSGIHIYLYNYFNEISQTIKYYLLMALRMYVCV